MRLLPNADTKVMGAASRVGLVGGRGWHAPQEAKGRAATAMARGRREWVWDWKAQNTITLHLHGNNQLAASAAAAFLDRVDISKHY